jgi:hypothetical protein
MISSTQRQPSSPERQAFEVEVVRVMRARSLSRSEAEIVAFENLVTERLDSTFLDTDSTRCACCGRAETRDSVLLPIGAGSKHTWLHPDCRAPWRARRRAEAIDHLAAMGVDAIKRETAKASAESK